MVSLGSSGMMVATSSSDFVACRSVSSFQFLNCDPHDARQSFFRCAKGL